MHRDVSKEHQPTTEKMKVDEKDNLLNLLLWHVVEYAGFTANMHQSIKILNLTKHTIVMLRFYFEKSFVCVFVTTAVQFKTWKEISIFKAWVPYRVSRTVVLMYEQSL